MLIDIVFGSKSAFRILSVLAEAPGQGFTKEEIKKIVRLGGSPLFRTINLLLKNGIITRNKVGKRNYYKLNLANKYSKPIIELLQMEKFDMNNMNPSIMLILREYVRQIVEIDNLKNVYVFGSMVKNSYGEDSDIDIAIITDGEIGIKDRIMIERISKRINERFKKIIQPHLFTEREFNSNEGLSEQVHREGIKLV